MKTLRAKSPKQQRGIGLLQVTLGLGILAVGSAYAFRSYTETSNTASNHFAFEEVSTWLGQMTNIGAANSHIYTGLDQDDVVDLSSIEDDVNLYGLDIVVAVATANWQITYPFPSAAACEYVESRVQNHPGLTTTAPACNASNQLVATIE